MDSIVDEDPSTDPPFDRRERHFDLVILAIIRCGVHEMRSPLSTECDDRAQALRARVSVATRLAIAALVGPEMASWKSLQAIV